MGGPSYNGNKFSSININNQIPYLHSCSSFQYKAESSKLPLNFLSVNIYNSKDAHDNNTTCNIIQSPAGLYFTVLVLSTCSLRTGTLCLPIGVGALRFWPVVGGRCNIMP